MDSTKLYNSELWKLSNALVEETDKLVEHAKFFEDPILKRDLIECSRSVNENLEEAFKGEMVNLAFLKNAGSFIKGLENNLEITKAKFYISKENYSAFIKKTNNVHAVLNGIINEYMKQTDVI